MKALSEEKVDGGLSHVIFEETTITDIDANRGVLRHRGLDITDLAGQPFERVAYLLLEGHWPTEDAYQAFTSALFDHRQVPDDLVPLIDALASAPAEIALQAALSSLGGSVAWPDWAIIARLPAIVLAHKAAGEGRELPPPDPALSLPADILSRLCRRPPSPLEADIVNLVFVLQADQGANASSFVARIAASADADIFQSLAAAMAIFSSPGHAGGAKAVIAMLEGLDGPDEVRAFVTDRQGAKLPIAGFVERSHPDEDPRLSLLHRAAAALCEAQSERSLLDKAEAAIDAMKSAERPNTQPSADLFLAVVYRLLGLQQTHFTALTVLARTAGWLAHIREQRQGSNALIRPRLTYAGPVRR